MNRLLLSLTLPFLASCSILGGDPPVIRYFAIEPHLEEPLGEAQAVEAGQRDTVPVRLRKIVTGRRIGERVVWSNGGSERGFYEYMRWIDAPHAALERLLRGALFEEHGLPRTEALQAASLDVLLVAFEEDRSTGEAHVELAVSLTDPDGHSLLDRDFRVRRPIAAGEVPDPVPIAEALSAALREACSELARSVRAALPPPHEEPVEAAEESSD